MTKIYEYPDGIHLPPVHPGRTLAVELESRGVGVRLLVKAMGVAPSTVYEIVNCNQRITGRMAWLLGDFLGTGAQFWNNLQTQYDAALAERAGIWAFTLEDNIPIPEPNYGHLGGRKMNTSHRINWMKFKVGQSTFVPLSVYGREQICNKAQRAGWHHKMTFQSRSIIENGIEGTRVWRTA